MKEVRKPNPKRSEAAFIFAIVLGLAVGLFVKKVRFGLLLGLALGAFIVFTGWIKATRK